MDYSFFGNNETKTKTGELSKNAQDYLRRLKQAKRAQTVEEKPEEKQSRIDEYDNYSNWIDKVLPENTLNDAPAEVYDYMQQDDEEGWGSARYLQSRLMGMMREFNIFNKGVPGEKLLSTYIEEHPRFSEQEGGIDAVASLGESKAYLENLHRTLEDRGLVFKQMGSSPLDVLDSGWDYIKRQVGPRGLSHLPKDKRSRVVGAVWAQEMIRNSSLKNRQDAINYVVPKVRRDFEPEFAQPFNYGDGIFNEHMKRLRNGIEELDGVVDETATFNDALPDKTLNPTMRLWYTTLTGKPTPDDITAMDMVRKLKPYVSSYNKAIDKAEAAYKWHLAGVDVPLKRIHNDGSLFSITELPGMKNVGVELARNMQDGVAYDNVEDHSRLYAINQMKKNATSVEDFLKNELGMSLKDIDLSKYGEIYNRVKYPERQRKGFSTYTPDDVYYDVQRLAVRNDKLKARLATKKHEYSKDWIQRNEKIISERAMEDDLSPEVVGNFMRESFKRSEKMSDTARKRQEAYESAYAYRYFNEIFHFLGTAMHEMGVDKFGNMTRGLHKFIYSSAHDAIPDLDKESLDMRGRTVVDVLREGVTKAVGLPENPDGALNDYLDDVIEGKDVPILSQIGMIMKDTVRGMVEIPFMSIEDPVSTGVMMGTLGGYNKASVGWAKKAAKKLKRPGLEPALLATFRPHEFIGNVNKAAKFALTDRMLFGLSANKFRKMINSFNPELRKQYDEMLRETVRTMGESEGDLGKMGRAMRDSVNTLGMLMADAEYTKKLSRVDLDGVKQKALDRNISFEAANALFATPFGNGKMVDGMVQKHINSGFFNSLMKLQDEVINNVSLKDRSGKSPAELMYNLNREYLKYKADRSEAGLGRIQLSLQALTGTKAEGIFNTVRDFFKKRYDYERSTMFDREAIENAVKENQYQVERTSARKLMFEGFRNSLSNRLEHLDEKINALDEGKQTRKVQAKRRKLIAEAQDLQRKRDISTRDIKVLRKLEKSHIITRTNANENFFREVENGWKTNGDQSYKDAFTDFLVSSTLNHKKTPGLVSKLFPDDPEFARKVRREGYHHRQKHKIKERKRVESYWIRRNRLSKLFKKQETRNKQTEEVRGFFQDNPPFKRAEAMRNARRDMRQLVDYAMKSENLRGSITGGLNRAVGDVVKTMLATHPGTDTSSLMRNTVQRVENFAQGPMGILDKIQDKVRLMSDDKFARFTELTRLPTDMLNKQQAGELRQLALEMRSVRDQLVRAQHQTGLITKKEMDKALEGGTDSHFYLSQEMRGEMKRYTLRDRLSLFPESSETPKHDRLNIQRKLNTPRVSWFDRADAEWKILDFDMKPGEKLSGAIKRAKTYIESVRKKYPGMDKNDIRFVNPLGEEDIAFRGLIDQDANFQVNALRDMIHDLAKTHLMNEVGMMQGLVRSDVPADVKRRGGWTKIGGDEGSMTADQRRVERMRWGSLYGKYVHTSFFDHISAYDDMSSVIRNVADSLRDTVAWSESAEGRGIMGRLAEGIEEATGKLQNKSLGVRLGKIASRHLRRSLITMNPASYVNNFMGALTFSHMAGAKVMAPEFWDGFANKESWSNFSRLVGEIGSEEFELLGSMRGREAYRKKGLSEADVETLELFKYATDRGIVERTDEGVFTGGQRRTSKRVNLRGLVKDIDETTLSNFNKARREVKSLNRTIGKLDQVINSGKLTDRQLPEFKERRQAYTVMRENASKRIGRLAIDNQMKITTSLPDRIIKAAGKTKTELGRFLSTDPESAVHRIVSSWYGNIDPMLKWQTLRYLVKEAGMTKEGALQRVLDFHQNYGTISPFIRRLRNIPFAGSFVPSFPAEALRITKNGLADNIGRTMAPFMATAMWNQTMLASQGMDITDLSNLSGDNESALGMARALFSQALLPMPGGRMATADTLKYSPLSVFMEPEGLLRGRIKDVEDEGLLGSMASVPLSFASNFVFNTPTMQLTQKHLAGVDPYTGRAVTDSGIQKPLGNFMKDLSGLFVPKAISRPYSYYQRVQKTPTSSITGRNIDALEGLVRTFGVNMRVKDKSEMISSLALRFMYKDERKSFIKNYMSLDDDIKNDIVQLKNLQANSTEWQDKLGEISGELLEQSPKTLKIGTETIKLDKFSGSEKQKIVKKVIAKAANNMFNVIEEMDPVRKLHFMRAVKHTWDREEPAYRHSLKSLTTQKYVNKYSDIGKISDIYVESMDMVENTGDPVFAEHLRAVAQTMVARTIQLRSRDGNRNAAMARALIRSTKGDRKKKIMEWYARKAKLLE